MFEPGVIEGIANSGIEIAIFVAIILLGILLGYIVGTLLAWLVRRILEMRELKGWVVNSGIVSLAFWSKLIAGVCTYIKWLLVSVMLNYVIAVSIERGVMYQNLFVTTEVVQNALVGIGIFVVFGVVGVVIGSVVYKMVKAGLDSVHVDEKMDKYGLSGALGGLKLTRLLAGLVMAYVVIIFLAAGIDAVAIRIGQMENRLVVMFHSLVEYYPQFLLGGLILIGGAIVGDFLQGSIKRSKSPLASDSVAWLVQAIAIFFALVIALPHFQIRENVSILTDSFKLIVAGVSLGLAIAMGLGLKDVFASIGRRYERKF